MNKRLVIATLMSACLGLGVGLSSAIAAPPVLPQPARTASSLQAAAQTRAAKPAASPDRDRDATRYAAAERARPEAASFQGGATFVVVGSTTAVILGIVLLVVLL